MVHTVGIAGVNGNVGVPAVKALVKAAQEGKIDLVVLHRPTTKLDHIQQGSNIEFRLLDLNGAPEDLDKAVKGINVFV